MGFINQNLPFERNEFAFFMPTQIIYGIGKASGLANELAAYDDLANCASLMIIADAGVVAAGLVDKVVAGLADSSYTVKTVFDQVPSDSDLRVIAACGAQMQELGIDLIIAIGGGSVMDTAKLASIIGAYGGEVRDYEGGFMVPGRCVPIIAIPTTVGTGSEVSVAALAKDHDTKTKITIASPYIYPRLAILDPEMVATLPGKLIAYTGMDALTHAVEAFVSSETQPISEALALRAAEMIYDNIVAATTEPENLDARAKMQVAATIAGVAFSSAPVGATHAISHTIGGLYGVHHGLANAIALPYVMEFNLACCPERYAALARAFDVTDTNLSALELGQKAIEKVKQLKLQLGIPTRFRELQVPMDEAALQQVTEIALADVCMAFNPRKAEFEEFYPLIQQVI
jgi:alcohol dehydrogenase class IV